MKLIRSRSNPDQPRLFNLTADPYEENDLGEIMPEQIELLQAKFEEAMSDAIPEYDRDFPRVHHMTHFPLAENPGYTTNSVDWCFP